MPPNLPNYKTLPKTVENVKRAAVDDGVYSQALFSINTAKGMFCLDLTKKWCSVGAAEKCLMIQNKIISRVNKRFTRDGYGR